MQVEEAPLLRVREVAVLLNVSVSQVWRWVWAGELPSIRVSEKVVRIRPGELSAWLEAKRADQ